MHKFMMHKHISTARGGTRSTSRLLCARVRACVWRCGATVAAVCAPVTASFSRSRAVYIRRECNAPVHVLQLHKPEQPKFCCSATNVNDLAKKGSRCRSQPFAARRYVRSVRVVARACCCTYAAYVAELYACSLLFFVSAQLVMLLARGDNGEGESVQFHCTRTNGRKKDRPST